MGYSICPPPPLFPLFPPLTLLGPRPLLSNTPLTNILVMGKAEGTAKDWHGHVTAVTVAPDYRRLGLAKTMMDELERVTTSVYNSYFVDLYVRVSNEIAIRMYEGMGYSVYRTVVEYYSSGSTGGGGGGGGGKVGAEGEEDEDAYDMRKPMPRDKHRKSVRENGREVRVLPHEVW